MSAIWKRPDGTVIETEKQFITELSSLLARAEKAEAALESAQKMCDHWDAKAAERQGQVNEWKARAEKAEAERDEVRTNGAIRPEPSRLEIVKLSCIDWERVRVDAAIAAMQALLPDIREFPYSPELVVQHADALVAELQKKEVQG